MEGLGNFNYAFSDVSLSGDKDPKVLTAQMPG